MRVLNLGIAILLAALMVGSSIFWTRDLVGSRREAVNVQLGFPFTFVSQDQSRYGPVYPHEATILSPWETPTRIDRFALLASLGVTSSILSIVTMVVSKIIRNRQRLVLRNNV